MNFYFLQLYFGLFFFYCWIFFKALGDISDPNDLFCTGKVRMKMATEKCRITGQSIIKHRNGKVDLGAVLDDPRSREHVCPYCSYSFAYKHVLERHVRQIHEKHLLCTYQVWWWLFFRFCRLFWRVSWLASYIQCFFYLRQANLKKH